MGGMRPRRAEEEEEATRRAPPCRRSQLTNSGQIGGHRLAGGRADPDAPQGLDGFGQVLGSRDLVGGFGIHFGWT
jgi:hypothetical protein